MLLLLCVSAAAALDMSRREVGAATLTTAAVSPGATNIFELEVPYRGKAVPLSKFAGKANLVVNIKMDDPVAGANLSGMRYLGTKYFSQLRIWAFPTDQGYFEPDVAELIRAKAYQQFGFGQYPAAVVFDKVDVLGKTAHPLFQYLQTYPNPNGVNRLTVNFEKFLLDGRGKVLRRYPRKFSPLDIEPDVQAIIDDSVFPEPSEDYLLAWQDATKELKGEYAFRQNYNVYSQTEASTDWAGLADLSFQ
ncbi:hypothetical protein CTAYLR_008781 [Chrysophaeum taylorii]|uniref:Uncharacterized protein n=1 Tax=Chrysophaeum taylorii TaxID=2483200 RepID=A0AAD7UR04_9STRA|nr:hypothetical protein CTAYLR_008781 [Chrysophaeum taylorii]